MFSIFVYIGSNDEAPTTSLAVNMGAGDSNDLTIQQQAVTGGNFDTTLQIDNLLIC
jgi:hypothetical protein